MAESLMDGLFNEMNRCREGLKLYESIPEGALGAIMIKRSIAKAEQSIKENDVVKMLIAYQDLKEIEV